MSLRAVTAPSHNASHVTDGQHSIQQSDNVFHSIAGTTNEKTHQSVGSVKSSPEDVIPLDESNNKDNDFKSFND
jgi:hypothetical protein